MLVECNQFCLVRSTGSTGSISSFGSARIFCLLIEIRFLLLTVIRLFGSTRFNRFGLVMFGYQDQVMFGSFLTISVSFC